MLNNRIRDLQHTKLQKGVTFDSILSGKIVSKKNASSVLQGAWERCKQHRKPANVLYLIV